jgi:hypothetical protein
VKVNFGWEKGLAMAGGGGHIASPKKGSFYG